MMRLIRVVLPLYMCLCIALGGASAAGFVANAVLQLLALGLLVWAIARPQESQLAPGEASLKWLLAGGIALIILQFVPLPERIWTSLGARAELADWAKRADLDLGALFLTLAPHETLKSAVWTLPALAVSVWMLRTRAYQPQDVAFTIVLSAGVALILAALQLGSSRESELYFYEITNYGSAVGFFANSNHMATLLLISIPFVAAIAAGRTKRFRTNEVAYMAAAIGALLIPVAGIFVNGSLFGYAMLLPVIGCSCFILGRFQRFARIAPVAIGVLVIGGLLLPFLTDEGLKMLTPSASLDSGDRRLMFANTFRAALDYGPFGSGLGTFMEVYRQYRDPLSITNVYVNHAHNDYLELLLETGILGLALIAAFLAWWFRRVHRIWKIEESGVYSRAATIASGTVMLHSFVDYPLRTAAISAIFAMCLALMARRLPGETSFAYH